MSIRHLLIVSLLVLGVVACTTPKGGFLIPAQHPPEAELGERRPVCTDCHEAQGKLAFADFNHTTSFPLSHRSVASRQGQVCSMCHQPSFCSDCHATAVELKPSLQAPTESYRSLPHRGDYLTRHKIDGRIDPTSCFRCHGNPKAARTCAPCHG